MAKFNRVMGELQVVRKIRRVVRKPILSSIQLLVVAWDLIWVLRILTIFLRTLSFTQKTLWIRKNIRVVRKKFVVVNAKFDREKFLLLVLNNSKQCIKKI